MVTDLIHQREDFPHYEKDRLASMEANLRRGDVLFDIGSELGWQSAIYAYFVGGANMCLFEATAGFWPTIKAIWQANDLAGPMATCCALVSNRTRGRVRITPTSWPPEAVGNVIETMTDWNSILSAFKDHATPEIALDDFSAPFGSVAKAITIDVEGAEYRVLRGAEATLRRSRPLVWVSVHPAVRLAKFSTSKAAILDFMRSLGYSEQYLGVDHEEHWFFYPKERSDIVLVGSPWRTYGKRDVTFEEAIPDWKDPWNVEKATWGSDA